VPFNSYAFILGFVPIASLVFHRLRHAGLVRSSIAHRQWHPAGVMWIRSLVESGESDSAHWRDRRAMMGAP
jgi:hypothetical protein